MSDYRRELAWKAGHTAALAGKPQTANNRTMGTIFYDDWHDGWNDGQRDKEAATERGLSNERGGGRG